MVSAVLPGRAAPGCVSNRVKGAGERSQKILRELRSASAACDLIPFVTSRRGGTRAGGGSPRGRALNSLRFQPQVRTSSKLPNPAGWPIGGESAALAGLGLIGDFALPGVETPGWTKP